MTNFKSHFKFNKQERSGIFFLLLLIVSFQLVQFSLNRQPLKTGKTKLQVDETLQKQVALLKAQSLKKSNLAQFQFNPNYINDELGYALGLSVVEIDRIQQYRAGGNFFNSSEDFQKISGVSNAKLETIAARFKFPAWRDVTASDKHTRNTQTKSKNQPLTYQDINRVTALELRAVRGIGPVLSDRIIKFRNALGGFIVFDQLNDVYGLSPEVVKRLGVNYKLLSKPVITPVNINRAGVEEIAKLVYINYDLAREIVAYRAAKGEFHSYEQLSEVPGFPTDKIERIKLYLSL